MHTGVQHISEAQAVYLEKFLNYSGTIIQLAAEMDVPLVDMIDTLSSPEVLSRIQNTKLLTDLKLEILAARAELAALETLEEITKNKAHDPVERRRAAGAILRATRSIRSRARARSRTPGAPPAPDSHSRSPGVPPDLNSPPSQNRAHEEASSHPRCHCSPSSSHPNQNRACQEAAAGHQTQSCTNSNTTNPDQQSPPSPSDLSPPSHDLPQLMSALDLAIYLGDEDTPKNIDPPLQGSKTTNDTPQGDALGSGCDAPSVLQDQDQPDQIIEVRSKQPQNASHLQTTHKNHPKEQEGKDNPWEGHPFQLAGNRVFGSQSSRSSPSHSIPSSRSSTHDPP